MHMLAKRSMLHLTVALPHSYFELEGCTVVGISRIPWFDHSFPDVYRGTGSNYGVAQYQRVTTTEL